jgi:hypothetical protein
MPRVLMNIMETDWSVHFIGPDHSTRVGPWLLFDCREEVIAILQWGGASAESIEQHDRDLRRWGVSSVALDLTARQFEQLNERGRGWPWNGYELRKMKEAGRYPSRIQTQKCALDKLLAMTSKMTIASE